MYDISFVIFDGRGDGFTGSTFLITVNGLRPLTNHNFFASGFNQNAYVRPIDGSLGDALRSDASGQLSFEYILEAKDAYTLFSAINTGGGFNQINRILCEVKSSDGLSKASEYIKVISVAVPVAEAPTTWASDGGA